MSSSFQRLKNAIGSSAAPLSPCKSREPTLLVKESERKRSQTLLSEIDGNSNFEQFSTSMELGFPFAQEKALMGLSDTFLVSDQKIGF